MITVKRKANFAVTKRRQKSVETSTGRVPRVSRLMALAIRFDQLIRDGVVADQAELAELGQVSRARLTQIMDLLQLAPDIQERLLFLNTVSGRPSYSERGLRAIQGIACWKKQHIALSALPCP